MTATHTRWLIALAALLVLGLVNVSIVGKERIKSNGAVIYLELAPVDPRSLMQGDYMALRFALARAIEGQVLGRDRNSTYSWKNEGKMDYAAIALDERRVATLAMQGPSGSLRMRYRIRGGQVWLGTNAFFFSEGDAPRYTAAKYGEFRLDKRSGEALLVGLRDANLKEL